jgi:tetratricopeptide (TPR) repeat protein
LVFAAMAAGEDRYISEGQRLLHEAKSLAEMTGGMKQPDRIAILLATAHRLDNRNFETLLTLINLSVARGDTGSMRTYLTRYLALVPGDEVALNWLQQIEYDQAPTDTAKQQLLVKWSSDVNLPNAVRAAAFASLADKALRGGATQLVGKWLKEAHTLAPDHLGLWQTVLAAAHRIRSSRPDAPAAAYVQLLQRYPTQAETAWQFGDELYALGLYQKAGEIYDYCRRLISTRSGGGELAEPYLLRLAVARYAQQQYDQAATLCRDVLKLNPNSLGAYQTLLAALEAKAETLKNAPEARNAVDAEREAAFTEAMRVCYALVPSVQGVDRPELLTQVAAFYLSYREVPSPAERAAAAPPPPPASGPASRPAAPAVRLVDDPATWSTLVASAAGLGERARQLAPDDLGTARTWALAKVLDGSGATDMSVRQVLLTLRRQGDQAGTLALAILWKQRADTPAEAEQKTKLQDEAKQLLKEAYQLNRGSPLGSRALKRLEADGGSADPLPKSGEAARYADLFLASPAAAFHQDKSKAIQAVFQLELEDRGQFAFGVPMDGLCQISSNIPLPSTRPAGREASVPEAAEQQPKDFLADFPLAPSETTPLPVALGPQGLIMARIVMNVEIVEKPGLTIRRVTEADLFRQLTLSPQQSIGQSVRLDVGPLDSIFMQLPQATLTLRITPMVGTEGLPDDPTKSGPDGFAAPAVTVKRIGFQATDENMKALMDDLVGNDIEKRIRAATTAASLYHEAVVPLTVRYEGYAPKPVDADALARGVLAAMGDPSWQVRAAAVRLAPWLGRGQEVERTLRTAAKDPVWLVRLCAIDMLATMLGKQAEVTINSAAVSDPDPMVRQMAFQHSRRLLGVTPQ